MSFTTLESIESKRKSTNIYQNGTEQVKYSCRCLYVLGLGEQSFEPRKKYFSKNTVGRNIVDYKVELGG